MYNCLNCCSHLIAIKLMLPSLPVGHKTHTDRHLELIQLAPTHNAILERPVPVFPCKQHTLQSMTHSEKTLLCVYAHKLRVHTFQLTTEILTHKSPINVCTCSHTHNHTHSGHSNPLQAPLLRVVSVISERKPQVVEVGIISMYYNVVCVVYST